MDSRSESEALRDDSEMDPKERRKAAFYTRYFVEAVANATAQTDAALLTDPTCHRDAPRRHWSSELLASIDARTGWVEPDLEPLPWTHADSV